MKRLNIRWRLAVGNTLAVAVVLLACGALVYALLRWAVLRQTDRLLLSQFEELQSDRQLATDRDTRIRHWLREFKEHVNLFGVVYDSSGSVIARTQELAEASVPQAPTSAPAEPGFSSATLPIIGPQRTLTARLAAGGREYAVVLMAPMEAMQQELGRVWAVLSSALPAALVLAAGVGYWLARQSLAPLERLRQKTDEITADRLDRRLPVDHPNDELGRLAQTINRMIGRLEKSFAEVRRFTADASHELRTPLAVLRAEIEVALEKSLTPDEQRRLLASVLEECQRLTALTGQLLAMSREDARVVSYARETIDLAALVGGVVETMTPLAETRSQTVQFQGGPNTRIHGDPSRLRHVFYNVLDNAIKYTSEGGRIQVAAERVDRAVRVTVEDDGIGIPAEHVPHVFDRFYRVDQARTRAEGGTGLGLSIAQSIVTAHGGRIELDSAPGRGTTCTVTLPAADE